MPGLVPGMTFSRGGYAEAGVGLDGTTGCIRRLLVAPAHEVPDGEREVVSKGEPVKRAHSQRTFCPVDGALGKVVADHISIIALSVRRPPRFLSRREGSESDRVPPDLDQRLGLAPKPIAKR